MSCMIDNSTMLQRPLAIAMRGGHRVFEVDGMFKSGESHQTIEHVY